MLKCEVLNVNGFKEAINGMRNPMNSWNKLDSDFDNGKIEIGDNDLKLMRSLFKAGEEHRKYARMINVYIDIIAPLYWWKEFDTYKVGTVCNSCSTMHKIHSKEFTLEDFSIEHLYDDVIKNPFNEIIRCLNFFRDLYIANRDKDDWWQLIQLLPSSYNQKRTIMINYEVAYKIIKQRKNHKLDEWHILVDELEKLPYMKDLVLSVEN